MGLTTCGTLLPPPPPTSRMSFHSVSVLQPSLHCLRKQRSLRLSSNKACLRCCDSWTSRVLSWPHSFCWSRAWRPKLWSWKSRRSSAFWCSSCSWDGEILWMSMIQAGWGPKMFIFNTRSDSNRSVSLCPRDYSCYRKTSMCVQCKKKPPRAQWFCETSAQNIQGLGKSEQKLWNRTIRILYIMGLQTDLCEF